MSYHEKRALVNMFSSVLITLGYSVYLYRRYLAGGGEILEDTRFWGAAFLILILASIVANILITIVFTIYYRLTAGENEPSISDERDQIIALKGSRNALYAFSIGVVLAMTTLVIDLPLYGMFVTLTYSGLVSAVIDDLTQFYLYRRGW